MGQIFLDIVREKCKKIRYDNKVWSNSTYTERETEKKLFEVPTRTLCFAISPNTEIRRRRGGSYRYNSQLGEV